jgi:hypothetical protein
MVGAIVLGVIALSGCGGSAHATLSAKRRTRQLWSASLPFAIPTTPALTGGVLVIEGSNKACGRDGKVAAYDAKTGSLLWKQDAHVADVADASSGIVLTAEGDDVVARSARDGEGLWHAALAADEAAATTNRIVVLRRKRGIEVRDRRTGTRLAAVQGSFSAVAAAGRLAAAVTVARPGRRQRILSFRVGEHGWQSVKIAGPAFSGERLIGDEFLGTQSSDSYVLVSTRSGSSRPYTGGLPTPQPTVLVAGGITYIANGTAAFTDCSSD